jgi:CheY-like chemotaxis protein
MTLRQALERLAEEGFVEARHGQGTYVRSRRALRGPVLVADDDPPVREVIVESLNALGYEVESVTSGEQAIERAARRHFTHVLLDVRMGGMGGTAAASVIARVDPRAVIVFVTAYPVDLLEREQAAPWPALVLRKPFDLRELERVLQLQVHN